MKKLILAAAAIMVAVGMTGCKQEDKTPKDIKNAEVVSTIAPGETVNEVVGDVVEVTDQNGEEVAVGEGEATQQVVTNSDGSTPAPAVSEN